MSSRLVVLEVALITFTHPDSMSAEMHAEYQ